MAKIQHENHFTVFGFKSEYLPISILIQSLIEYRKYFLYKAVYEQCLGENQGFSSALWM